MQSGLLVSGCGFTSGELLGYQNGQCCYHISWGCCSGRPFVFSGRAHTAPARRKRSSWNGAHRPQTDGLDCATQLLLAEAWTRDALLEHASIASFSRFSLAGC
jgi:hypothetical protein